MFFSLYSCPKSKATTPYTDWGDVVLPLYPCPKSKTTTPWGIPLAGSQSRFTGRKQAINL
ncbi:hypothetical protein [Prevotella falsenii]|uniref:hypothetical protein n=1 Tax=Prevotella falsenii TaxID=515414 RepID=UPI0012EC7275|nr:hypothetical protein [Prevotella falsenii]